MGHFLSLSLSLSLVNNLHVHGDRFTSKQSYNPGADENRKKNNLDMRKGATRPASHLRHFCGERRVRPLPARAEIEATQHACCRSARHAVNVAAARLARVAAVRGRGGHGQRALPLP